MQKTRGVKHFLVFYPTSKRVDSAKDPFVVSTTTINLRFKIPSSIKYKFCIFRLVVNLYFIITYFYHKFFNYGAIFILSTSHRGQNTGGEGEGKVYI